MKKISLWIIAISSVIIIVQLTLIDFENLIWSNNTGGYLVILSMICVIISMILAYHFKNDDNIDDTKL